MESASRQLGRWAVLAVVAVVAVLAGLAGGCREEGGGAAGRGESAAARPAEAAGEGAMCAEHGVLEALCTKCNPRLAVVFQAKGDWCKEHELPESICPICHPERGGKPAADVSGDEAPADGLKIRFKRKDTAAMAGIRVEKAAVRAGSGGVRATARLVYDATRLAQLNARSPGVVRSIRVDVGSRVKKGDPLIVIDSAEVGAGRARLSAARARVEVAEQRYQREQGLGREGLGLQSNLLTAKQELDEARGEHAALVASLSVLGPAGGGGGGYTLTAPLSGVVTQRGATIGALVSTEQLLYEIVDTSSMWAELDVAEADLPVVAEGQGVTIALDGLPGRALSGEITYLAPALDPHTRTARARVPLANADGALRANMYGQARIAAADRQSVMVPRGAVQRVKGVALAFVKITDDEYEARRVEVGGGEGELVEVKKGLRAGESVVTQGSFLLKTETLKDSIGAGCCEAD
ncbi:MAG TPA: efflux RND transporter periplasmic adaptor subunit [Candidatus Nanopelagicales bacterium]|nr:efflux RND transporter periplasmic adaptor subunit [Candidatus Nanopelagicales bacterium]